VGIVLADKTGCRDHILPRRASRRRRTVCIAGRPPLIM
jgi:hypothetical protein